MSRSLNKATIIGNLGQDPDVRFTTNGNAVANFSVATDESYKDKQSGQMVPRTEWHKITIFGKLAEIAGQYLRKGSKVYIEGRLQTRKWHDQNGLDHYTTEILVDINGQMLMLDGKPERDDSAQQRPAQQPARQQQQPQMPPPVDDFEDSIPFK